MSEGVRPAPDWGDSWNFGAIMANLGASEHGVRIWLSLAKDGPLSLENDDDGGYEIADIPPDACLCAAALLLQRAGPDGKPLFTRADVEVIRHALLGWDGMGDRGDGEIDHVSPKYPNADTLADRLESVLPPEEPEP